MDKHSIHSRKGLKIAVIVEKPENPKGLAFVMHGLGGFKEQPHIETMAKAFLNNGYTVVRFDTTNSFGESAGDYEEATTTNYFNDLADVINWSASKDWFVKPFVLAGHSLGGLCVAMYAELLPHRVKALAPISTAVSGEFYMQTFDQVELDDWKRVGYKISPSTSKPGTMRKLKWSFMEDFLKFNLISDAGSLNMPILMIVGDKDDKTPLAHQKILFEKLRGKKELHVIKDAPHTFIEDNHLQEVYQLFDKWIKSL